MTRAIHEHKLGRQIGGPLWLYLKLPRNYQHLSTSERSLHKAYPRHKNMQGDEKFTRLRFMGGMLVT